MIAIIGSAATNFRLNGFRKHPKDLDIVCTYHDLIIYKKLKDEGIGKVISFYPINKGKSWVIKTENTIIEAEIAWPGSSAEKLLSLINSDPETLSYTWDEIITFKYPSLDILYMLKMSHRFLKNSPHFKKTMEDIHILRHHGAKINDKHMEFYKDREKVTYHYSHPKLNKRKTDFFGGDGVDYVFDHDSIHESVKIMDKPAYTYFKDDEKEVWCSKEKFFKCDEEIRINAVLEESLVLALERSQIPFPEINKDRSFNVALEKVCTSITSGWFREYAWEKYYLVKEKYSQHCSDYVVKFWEDVEQGIVKKLKEENEN